MKNIFTDNERLILYNQYQILSILEEDEVLKKEYNHYMKVLQNGYVHDYSMFNDYIYEEMDTEDCEFVWKVLQMYRTIYSSFYALESPSISKDEITFKGFDGNEEPDEYAYCKFIINDLERYQELLDNNPHKDLNTHTNTKSRYKNMLDKFSAYGNKYNLTEEELKYLLNIND